MAADPERLDALEHAIGKLTLELSDARRALAVLRAELSAAPLIAQRSVPPIAAPPRGDGMENLVGKYGALALAVLTIVMGAGALVSWAISHALLGPSMRVALGAILALVTAAVGAWLRTRGSREFGNSLIALALAIVHVVAWGAGPRLGLVPASAALGVAVIASVALAALALKEDEQLLYAAGFGGALVAPFVMATGTPHLELLAGYGVIILAAAIGTIGERTWRWVVSLVLVGTILYTASVIGYRSGVPWIDREFAAVFAGLIAITALLWENESSQPAIAVCALATMAVVTMRAAPHAGTPLVALMRAPDIQLVALAGTALVFAAVRRIREPQISGLWALPVVALPAIFVSAALSALGPVAGPVSGAIVLTWALAYSVASLGEVRTRRGVLLMMAGFAGLWAITLVFASYPDMMPVVIAVYAVLLAVVARSEQQPAVMVATAASLVAGFILAALRLDSPPGYVAMPFISTASFGAASVVGAAYLSLRHGLPAVINARDEPIEREQAAVLTTAALAFVWGHMELRRAFSADASTFLLIGYYALCGVCAIWQGRVHASARLRQAGLSLAVFAALYALVAASDVQQIGLRVGSYLLVGGFLLGVAWLYRGEGISAAGTTT